MAEWKGWPGLWLTFYGTDLSVVTFVLFLAKLLNGNSRVCKTQTSMVYKVFHTFDFIRPWRHNKEDFINFVLGVKKKRPIVFTIFSLVHRF
jgi:hypothetical protein